MTYGVECWSIKKQNMHKMDVAKMRMLRLMCGKLVTQCEKGEQEEEE